MIKTTLGKNKLSQLRVGVDLKKDEETKIDLTFTEFRVIFAAQTLISLANLLKQVNNIVNEILPKFIANKKQEPKLALVLKKEEKPVPQAVEPVVVKDSKVIFKGELSNIVLMLPESVTENLNKYREKEMMRELLNFHLQRKWTSS